MKIEGKISHSSALCEEDYENLRIASSYGVNALMVPFVQEREDLVAVHEALEKTGLNARIYAKIENRKGIDELESFMDLADVIVIARGDLGQDAGLIDLPEWQMEIEAKCRKANKPYMVVTELLASMRHSPVCTRAEANDVYLAVLEGASSMMLTNETAGSDYPYEAMETFCALIHKAQTDRERLI